MTIKYTDTYKQIASDFGQNVDDDYTKNQGIGSGGKTAGYAYGDAAAQGASAAQRNTDNYNPEVFVRASTTCAGVGHAKPTRDDLVRKYQLESQDRARKQRFITQNAQIAREKERANIEAAKRERKRVMDAANARTEASGHSIADLQKKRSGAPVRGVSVDARLRSGNAEFGASSIKGTQAGRASSHGSSTYSASVPGNRKIIQAAKKDLVIDTKKETKKDDRVYIDARGSFDSRAFDEQNLLSHTSVNSEDKPLPMVSTDTSAGTWKSQAQTSLNSRGTTDAAKQNAGGAAGAGGALAAFFSDKTASIPFFYKAIGAIIGVLAVVLLVLIFTR